MKIQYTMKKTKLFLDQFYKQFTYYIFEANENTAQKFIKSVNDAINKIAAFPFAYSRFKSNYQILKSLNIHKKQISNFPFIIFYQIVNQTIIIRCIYMTKCDYESMMISDINFNKNV